MKPGDRSYRFAAFLFRRVLYRISVEGAENEPAAGAVLLCANHISDSDPILLSAVTRRLARFMAKKELFSIPLLNRVIRSFGAFPVHRGQADPSSLKHCLALLSEGEMVGVFPQGTRYRGRPPKDTEVKSGLGMLALRSKAVILPVLIKTKKYKIHFFSKITIRFGKPIGPEEYLPGEPCASEYSRISSLAFARICALDTSAPDGTPAGAAGGGDALKGPAQSGRRETGGGKAC